MSTINREALAQEYISLVCNYYPKAGRILKRCFVKIIECRLEKLRKSICYLGIYYPDRLFIEIKAQEDAFREISENMGFEAVVCINANRLVRDPASLLKQENPRLWLELYWIAMQGK